ncbi:MAG: YIP1 family protein [Mangrovicoccus sp.]|nr:YIP1 family protein [Mangrovicoccus sp.]
MTERAMAAWQLDFSPRGLYAAMIETVRNPRAVAERLLDMTLPMGVIWTLLAAVSAVSVVLVEGGLLLVQAPGEDTAARLPNPFMIFGLQLGLSTLLASVTHQIGRLLGGTGSFAGALLLIAWIQVVMAGMQVLQVLLLLVAPPLADVLGIASGLLFIWLFTAFAAVMHGFRSMGMGFATALGSVVAVGVLLGLLFSLAGVPLPTGTEGMM